MRKDGQVTTFVIIGFVVVLVVALFLVSQSFLEIQTLRNNLHFEKKIDQVKEDLSECIRVEIAKAFMEQNLTTLQRTPLNCSAVTNDGYTYIEKAKPRVTITQHDDGISVLINYPLRIEKDNASTTLEPYTEDISYRSEHKIILDKRVTATDNVFHGFADLTKLAIPEGTSVSKTQTELILRDVQTPIVTIPDITFTPWAALYLINYENNSAILDTRTNKTLPTVRVDSYLVSTISSGGTYSVVSCDVYSCCWNHICDTSENVNTCNECGSNYTVPSGTFDLDWLFGGTSSDGDINNAQAAPTDSSTTVPTENPPTDNAGAPPTTNEPAASDPCATDAGRAENADICF